jgi:NADPH:quinone reductase-like Zn-dependent oxidoreductase
MPCVTAYGALIDIAKLRREDFVVITAASSGVGLAAIQIANMVGATTIAVTRTSAKKQTLLEFGAAHVIAQRHIRSTGTSITDRASGFMLMLPAIRPCVNMSRRNELSSDEIHAQSNTTK